MFLILHAAICVIWVRRLFEFGQCIVGQASSSSIANMQMPVSLSRLTKSTFDLMFNRSSLNDIVAQIWRLFCVACCEVAVSATHGALFCHSSPLLRHADV